MGILFLFDHQINQGSITRHYHPYSLLGDLAGNHGVGCVDTNLTLHGRLFHRVAGRKDLIKLLKLYALSVHSHIGCWDQPDLQFDFLSQAS
jgi:hypothetical protein